MGVHGLWELLSPVGHRVSNEHVRNKVLAVDISIWLTQFVKAMRDAEGAQVRNAHLLGVFRRCLKLLFLSVRPILVFDGATPAIKRRTLASRRAQREKQAAKLRRLAEKMLVNQLRQHVVNAAITKSGKRKLNGLPPLPPPTKLDEEEQLVPSPTERVVLANEQTKAQQIENDEVFAADLADEEEQLERNRDAEAIALPEDAFDLDDEAVGSLPPNVQAEVFKQIKLRQRAKHREQMMLKQRNPSEFSKTQIEGFLRSTALNRKISTVRRAINSKSGASQRIASDSGRRFVLDESPIKNSDVGQRSDSDDDELLSAHKRGRKTNHAPTDILARIRASRDQSQMKARLSRKHLKQPKPIESRPNSGVGWASRVLEGQGGLFLGAKSGLQSTVGDESDSSLDEEQPEIQFALQTSRDKQNAATLVDSRSLGDDEDDDVEWEDGATDGNIVVHNASMCISEPSIANEKKEEFTSRELGIQHNQTDENRNSLQEDLESDTEHVAGIKAAQESKLSFQKEAMGSIQWASGQIGSIRSVSDGDEAGEQSLDMHRGHLKVRGSQDDEIASQRMPSQECFKSGSASVGENEGTKKQEERQLEGRAPDSNSLPKSGNGQSKCHSEEDRDLWIGPERSVRSEDPEKKHDGTRPPLKGLVNEKTRIPDNRGSLTVQSSRSAASDLMTLRHESRKKTISEEEEERDLQLAIARSIEAEGQTGQAGDSPDPVPSEDMKTEGSRGDIAKLSNVELSKAGPSEVFPKSKSPPLRDMMNENQNQAAPESQLNLGSIPPDRAANDGARPSWSQSHSEEEVLNISDVESRHYEAGEMSDERLKELRDELDVEAQDIKRQRNSEQGAAESVSDEMYAETRDLLKLFGIPYLEAPTEAEAQCAFLDKEKVVDGVITEDSDAFLFGARTVYRRLFSEGRFAEAYESQDVKNSLGLDREMLIRLAYLLGSDYTSGVRGVGVVNSMEILEAFPGERGLEEFREWMKRVSIFDEEPDESTLEGKSQEAVRRRFCWKHRNMKRNWEVREGFPNRQVAEAYRRPDVDKSTEKFKWGRVDFNGLARFCWDKFGWEHDKFNDAVAPLQKKLSEESGMQQRRIDEFFKPHRFAKIRSERLQKAVKGIAGEDAKELMSTLQPKAKRRKTAPVAHIATVLPDEEEAMYIFTTFKCITAYKNTREFKPSCTAHRLRKSNRILAQCQLYWAKTISTSISRGFNFAPTPHPNETSLFWVPSVTGGCCCGLTTDSDWPQTLLVQVRFKVTS
ncbi:DNA repair protein complementing XPG, RAD2 [Chondrus crispus]|uniref:DNA repair protein complementing XPG, RAD2 n=1 Tax=Chondrus crispus TaxID=2769 RepID=R7QAT8_CHOCR|nr:DNA repair protein complementing XPG, RAD2 [Chondrus crispus]CDF34506.1 DNA repair protein complementing XPG, RAD2 [Chondrus crispus]|eukprot:XP_005714325.1 DNA repair protein complementing XPG, RAD2 [Chondrus crispus]